MNRTELKQFIMENYSVEADYPWLTAALDGSVSDDKIKMLLCPKSPDITRLFGGGLLYCETGLALSRSPAALFSAHEACF